MFIVGLVDNSITTYYRHSSQEKKKDYKAVPMISCYRELSQGLGLEPADPGFNFWPVLTSPKPLTKRSRQNATYFSISSFMVAFSEIFSQEYPKWRQSLTGPKIWNLGNLVLSFVIVFGIFLGNQLSSASQRKINSSRWLVLVPQTVNGRM